MIGKDIHKAAELLKQGELVAIPTETVYGLAARISDDAAVLRIFEAKDRPAFDPLIVHIAEWSWLEELTPSLPEKALALAKKVWPGPLTLVVKRSARVSDLITSGQDTVAVRMPRNTLTLETLKRLGEPVAAPSANPFGYVSPTTAAHVEAQLGDKVAYILDGGPSEVGLESTIVSFLEDRPAVLRLGGMSLEELEKLIGEKPDLRIATHSNPEAPGQLDTHYATRIPLIHTRTIEAAMDEHSGRKMGLLSFRSDYPGTNWVSREVLSNSGDLAEAARNLFAAMRRLDGSGADIILAEYFPDEGLGRAINDRLQRASHRK